MILLVVLPSLLYMAPQTRDNLIRCPKCKQEVPFVVRKFIPREVLHSSRSYRFRTYSLECSADGIFSFPVFGLVDQGATSKKQRISAALHLRIVTEFAAGIDYTAINKDLEEAGVGLSRSTIWRQLKRAPWSELSRLHLTNRWRRIFNVSVFWEVDQKGIDERTFTEPSKEERDVVLFGGIVGLIFEDANAAYETGAFLATYINETNFGLTWTKVALLNDLPDDLEMPADFASGESLRKCLKLMKDAYAYVAQRLDSPA